MLPLLSVSLIVCLVSISGEGCEKLQPKKRNNSIIASFHLEISPMVSYPFRENWEAGDWNQGIFRILLCALSVSYLETILEATITRVFPTQIYHVVFQLVKKILSLDVTVVFPM